MFAFRLEDYPEGTLVRGGPPIRLFRWTWLERLTHTNWVEVCAVGLSLTLGLTVKGLQSWSWPGFAALFAVGFALLWPLTEYCMHRFLFHFEPRYRWQAILRFLLHDIHHVQPEVPTRLLMPPLVSLSVAALILALLRATCGAGMYPLGAGMALGYLTYDLMHFWLHFGNPRLRWFRALKRHHMRHHYLDPAHGFGVSTALWDRLLGTECSKT